ncbi:hypothetical protein CF70_002385, partial [Cupriavidus sp. SK-3]|uniref:hypothetical protein n=1 Tax=Cupriavidus sp. SK-3 TaxID=1470558 RepID=UPI000451B535
MLVFLDTEFTDPIDCELISIALVAEDGRKFYAEVLDFDRSKCNQFVRAAVLSQLSKVEGAEVVRDELPSRLRTWFTELPDDVIIGCDNFTDWELLIDILGDELPSNLRGRFDLGNWLGLPGWKEAGTAYHESPGRTWHHALHDAMA